MNHAELQNYLMKSPISGLINKITFERGVNGKIAATEIIFSDPKKAVEILQSSPQFINANYGFLHDAEIGENYDFRSYTAGTNRLGNKSLQINIGKLSGKARADLDRFNPAQDFGNLIGHLFEVLQII